MELKGKVAVVTGAAQGIGEAVVTGASAGPGLRDLDRDVGRCHEGDVLGDVDIARNA